MSTQNPRNRAFHSLRVCACTYARITGSSLRFFYVIRDEMETLRWECFVGVYFLTAIAVLGVSLLFYCLSRFSAEIRQYAIRRPSAFVDVNKVLGEAELLALIFGVLLCSIIAALVCVLFQLASFKQVLPICFLLVIAGIANRFGYFAGVLGTILSALIFAVFLFEPLRGLAVQNQVAKSNLIWMLLGGLALSALFSNPPKRGKAGKQ